MPTHQSRLKKFADNTPNPDHIQIVFEVENLDDDEKKVDDSIEKKDDATTES